MKNIVLPESIISNENEMTEETNILLSKIELDIINTLIKIINEDKNIILYENFYCGPILYREGLWNDFCKSLKKENVDDILIYSLKENNKKVMYIDKNNVFDFKYSWYRFNYNETDIEIINNSKKVQFSRIGFNEEKTKAIIFIDIKTKDEGNGKAGNGEIYLLENKDEQWKIINIICVYNSFKMGSTHNCA